MTVSSYVLRGGRAVLPGDGVTECDIAVEAGRIAAILAPGTFFDALSINVSGLVIMPGAIDPHLHLGHGKDISRPREKQDASGETAAAALGGVTCFIPYLMATEPYENLFGEVRAVTEAGARIDFSYHFVISTEDQLKSVPHYIRENGVPSFKIFMNNRGGEGARLGLPDIDDGFLFRLAELAGRHGGMVCPHPETIELAWVLRDRLKAADPEGKGGLKTWNESRPPFVEADAVQRAAYIAWQAEAPLYVVHTSSAEALDAGLRLRDAGADIVFETCPHYLTHDIEWEGGDIGKINPPLRTAADRDYLWAAIADGTFDTIGTDHIHRDVTSKQGGIWNASPGCPGLETLLPILISEGHHRRAIPLERIAELTATNVADIMGLSDRKGRIAPGLDADFAIIDPEAQWVVSRDHLASSAGYSIYEGWTLKGKIIHTIVRGRFVLRDGVLDETAIGTGQFQKRALS
jgi:dihydropyrimidinase